MGVNVEMHLEGRATWHILQELFLVLYNEIQWNPHSSAIHEAYILIASDIM